MSTKNLSRTVIEGGRVRSNKWDRRHSSRAERAKVREYLANVTKDPEFAEEETEPKRTKVYKEFDDKLGPVFRWIRSQIGRKWDEVKSEVFATFDTRNLAGKHIVFDHLLSSVQETENPRYSYREVPGEPESSYYYNDFYVDEEGILRQKKYVSRKSRWHKPGVHTKVVTDWLNGRIVGKVGNKMYWFIPVSRGGHADEWKCEWKAYMSQDDVAHGGTLEYYKLYYEPVYDNDKNIIDHKPEWKTPFFYKVKRISSRQDQEFTKEDLEIWEEIPAWCQEIILQWSPNSPNPPQVDRYPYY